MVLSKKKISFYIESIVTELLWRAKREEKTPNLLLLTIPIHEERETIIFTSTEKNEP